MLTKLHTAIKKLHIKWKKVMVAIFGRHWLLPSINERIIIVHCSEPFGNEISRELAIVERKERLRALNSDGGKVYWLTLRRKDNRLYKCSSNDILLTKDFIWELHTTYLPIT
jgi:hypothetical protein